MEKSLIFHFDCYLLLLESSGGNNLNIGLGGFGSLFFIEAIELIFEN